MEPPFAVGFYMILHPDFYRPLFKKIDKCIDTDASTTL